MKIAILRFDNKEINMFNFLDNLKQHKRKIEENNALVFLKKGYFNQLAKKCYATETKENGNTIINLSTKSNKNDYYYFVKLLYNNKPLAKTFRVINVETNDPQYDGVLYNPNEKTDLSVLYFAKNLEMINEKEKHSDDFIKTNNISKR